MGPQETGSDEAPHLRVGMLVAHHHLRSWVWQANELADCEKVDGAWGFQRINDVYVMKARDVECSAGAAH